MSALSLLLRFFHNSLKINNLEISSAKHLAHSTELLTS